MIEYNQRYSRRALNEGDYMKITNIKSNIEADRPRSAWKRGVQAYAMDLLTRAAEWVDDLTPDTAHNILLSGATSWTQYSDGGSALIYDGDICERLCNRTERRRTKNGQRNPNRLETWLDCQARALYQAELLILNVICHDDVIR